MQVTQNPRVAQILTIFIASLILYFTAQLQSHPIRVDSDEIMQSCFTEAHVRFYVKITIDSRTLESAPYISSWYINRDVYQLLFW